MLHCRKEKSPANRFLVFVILILSLMFVVFTSGAAQVSAVATDTEQTSNKQARLLSVRIKSVLPKVIEIAQQYHIEPALLLAIIHQESRFNPHAKSHAGALGLMQVMPNTAGAEVSTMLMNKNIILPSNILLKENNNLLIGTLYLQRLKQHYFKGVTHIENRRIAMIAAYNGGIGTLTKLLKTRNKHWRSTLNNLSAQKLLTWLIAHHPFAETRQYIKQVNQHYNFYRQLLSK